MRRTDFWVCLYSLLSVIDLLVLFALGIENRTQVKASALVLNCTPAPISFFFFLLGLRQFSLYSPCWPRTHNPPASACWGLKLQVCATIIELLLITSFCWSTWHQLEPSEKGNLGWENASIRLFAGSLWGICLTNDWCGRAQLPLGRASPPQLVLSSTRKQTEGATTNKSVSSAVLWSLLRFLLPRPCLLTSLGDQLWLGPQGVF